MSGNRVVFAVTDAQARALRGIRDRKLATINEQTMLALVTRGYAAGWTTEARLTALGRIVLQVVDGAAAQTAKRAVITDQPIKRKAKKK